MLASSLGSGTTGAGDSYLLAAFAAVFLGSDLIDTGFMREESGALMAQKFGIPEWISPLRLLQELDIEPDQVADILISHAHLIVRRGP